MLSFPLALRLAPSAWGLYGWIRSIAHNMYKTKLVIPSTQTDILPQHKLFLCGYAVLNRTVWVYHWLCTELELNYTLTHVLQNILYCSLVFDIWLTHCYTNACSSNSLCYSIVNIVKCKQQVTELLLHMIAIKFWKFDEYVDWLLSDGLLNSRLPFV
jgi:hypothetical protein